MVKKLWPYIEAAITGDHYAEPFAGGGSTFLHVARQRPNLKISINDKDADVANFWSVVCGGEAEFVRLCAAVQESREPMDDPQQRLRYWRHIRDSEPDDAAQAAFRFLLLNRTCWGGQINSSPIGGYAQNGWKGRAGRGLACNYYVDTILENLHEARRSLAGRTKVTNLSVFDFLGVVGQAGFYFDPPYFPGEINRLYRETMSPAEHQRLADGLREFRHPWVLSYDNSSTVRALYTWASLVEIAMRSSHRSGRNNWKTKVELLILPASHNRERIQPHHRTSIPSALTALSSYGEMEAMNASPKKNMNAQKGKSKYGERPGKGSKGSNGKVDWTTVRLSTKGLHPTQVGKIEWCLKVLQETEKSSPEFKEALDHMWEQHYRFVEPDKESFCNHLGLSVAEAEAILNPANQPASETAPEETEKKHTPETVTALGSKPMMEKDHNTQPPDHEQTANASEPKPEATKPASTLGSQRRSSRKGKKPSPPSDKKAQSVATGEKEANNDTDAAAPPKAAPEASGEAPGIPHYEDHPLANILPLDDGEPFDQLADDIGLNGLREHIVLFEGKILDGRRRYRACVRSGTVPTFSQFEGSDPAAFVLSKNIHRRNLDKGQRAAIAAELLLVIEKESRERRSTTNGAARDNQGRFSEKLDVEKIPPTDGEKGADPQSKASERQKSRDIAGTALDVNPHYVSDAKAIMENAPDLHEQLKQGKITISQAKREWAKRKPKKQSKLKKESKVECLPFTVIFWDQSRPDVPMPEILHDKKKRKTLASAVAFHLTAQPNCSFGNGSKDGFCDAALFVVPMDNSEWREEGNPSIQVRSCLFLVARTIGEIPKPAALPPQMINVGPAEARKMIEKMWPTAPRLISDGKETPPEGWQIG